MIYLYDQLTSPDLNVLEFAILTSAIFGIYQYLRWDKEDLKLKINLSRVLNSEEKIILDNLITENLHLIETTFSSDVFHENFEITWFINNSFIQLVTDDFETTWFVSNLFDSVFAENFEDIGW